MAHIAVCECGWRSKRTRSEAVATYAGRQHRCSRYAQAQAFAAAAARRRVWHGETKPCLHKVASHIHGTHACYVLDRCKCRPCIDANGAYEHRRARQRAMGVQAYVDAGPARAHVAALMAAGLGPKLLAIRSGVAHGAISKLMYGDYGRSMPPSRRIRAATEAKLLAVSADVDTLGARVGIDPGPSLRRIQALACDGWSISEIGRRIGMAPGNFHKLLSAEVIGAGTARKLRALYLELGGTVPVVDGHRTKISASRARRYASAHGWQPSEAWDDIDTGMLATLDDDIDEIAVERACHGELLTLNAGEYALAIDTLTHRGLRPGQIAELLHTSSYQVLRQIAATTEERTDDADAGPSARPSRLPSCDAGDSGEVRRDPHRLRRAGADAVAVAS